MRLLNVETFQFEDLDEKEEQKYEYAILSHKWVGKETLLRDLRNTAKVDILSQRGKPKEPYGISKIAWSAFIARERKRGYIWIDTCCIDKTSSAELSESINSTFKWYGAAKECYAYLPDVSWNGNEETSRASFRESVWFKRGWTLQELLAPQEVRFYDQDWKFFGTKTDLATDICAATNIDQKYLWAKNFGDASIATKMSWASRRETTRQEDQAYCLLGIFNITLDTRYGEGRMAFIRFQKELIANYNDESIFAWTSEVPSHGLLAPDAGCFHDSADITHISSKQNPRPPYGWTPQGIRFPVPAYFPDHSNGIDWNNWKAHKRKEINLTLNCWRIQRIGAEEEPKKGLKKPKKGLKNRPDTITIHLTKTDHGWQRDQCSELGLTKDSKVIKCKDFMGNLKTRDVLVPQTQ